MTLLQDTISCDNCGIEMWDDEESLTEMEIHEDECDWDNDPNERFERGDRVQYSDFGKHRLDRDHREGEIVGFSWKDEHCVRVVWDGRKTAMTLAHSFVKHV